jgi:hypothetical protein
MYIYGDPQNSAPGSENRHWFHDQPDDHLVGCALRTPTIRSV